MPENSNTISLMVARPTINVDGQDRPALAEALLELLIIETISGLYRCETTLVNWGSQDNTVTFLFFDRSLLEFGKPFKIKLGSVTLFDGRITGLEAHFPAGRPPELVVLAEDRFQDLRMTRRTRTFTDLSDADVIRQIATEHGLTSSINMTGPTYKVLAQINQSDLAFLRERARSVDAELWMDGSTLNAKSHANRNSATLQLDYGSTLQEFVVMADLAQQCTSVSVNGWDVSGKASLKYEATESAISHELNGDISGISILQSAFGARQESLAHTVPLNDQEAQSVAEAYLKMNARRFITGRGVADTDGKLRVGNIVDLQGLGPLFSGKYYVTEVQHIFDLARGLRSEFIAERPGIGRV
jgi:hypothetical protein